MSKTANYISFDLGASGGTVCLASYNGAKILLDEVCHFHHRAININKALYWDIFNIYLQMNNGVTKAFSRAGGNVESIGIDSFSNDFAIVDENNELLTPVRCYRDPRTKKYEKEIYEIMPAERIHRVTGTQKALFSTLMQLGAMNCAGQGGLFGDIARLLFVPSLLRNMISGESVTEYTIGSVSQLVDYNTKTWSEDIINAYGLPSQMFTKIVGPAQYVGKTTNGYNKQLGIKGCRVATVCEHDTASAFLSSPMEGGIIISSGTWVLVGVETKQPIVNSFTFNNNIANEGGMDGHTRILKNVMGSWILQEIKAELAQKGHMVEYDKMSMIASQSAPSRFHIDVDADLFFTPGNMIGKINAMCEMKYGSKPETLGELLRCVYESNVFKYRHAIEMLEHLTGKHYPHINLLGGGSQDKFGCQLTADICRKPVYAGPVSATSYGNILAQMMAAREVDSIMQGRELIRSSVDLSEYLPADNTNWDDVYKEFLDKFALN